MTAQPKTTVGDRSMFQLAAPIISRRARSADFSPQQPPAARGAEFFVCDRPLGSCCGLKSALNFGLGLIFVVAAVALPMSAPAAQWDGGASATDANWTTAANWTNDVAPRAGDLLVFPAGIAKTSPNNNFQANTIFGGFSIFDAYTLRGNAVDLTNLVDAPNVNATATLDFNIRLQGPLTFSSALGGSLTMPSTRTINLNNFDLTFGGLAGTHNISADITNHTLGSTRVIVTARFLAPPLDGIGGNTVTLSGTLINLPLLVTNRGALVLNGSAGRVDVGPNSFLSGRGTMGALNASGTVSPGSGAPGRLEVHQGLNFASAANFAAKIAGTTPDTSYDQLQCSPPISLGSARLQIVRDPAFVPAIGATFIILTNTGASAISGTFLGLVEGATTTVDGVTYRISYLGARGNSLTLSVTAVAPELVTRVWDGGGANNFWATAANWNPDIAPVATNNLEFPRGAVDAVCTNNFISFPSTPIFNSLRFSGSFVTNNYPLLRGNSPIRLLSGVVGTGTLGGGGVVGVELPITLAASQVFSNASADTIIELRSNVVATPFILTFRGSGAFRATGIVTSSDSTNVVVQGGHLIVNGAIDGKVAVNGGGLSGKGTVGPLTVSSGSLSPGEGGTGILTVKGLTVLNSAATLNLQLTNASSGSGFTQLVVSNGNLALGSATLNIFAAPDMREAIGATFTIVKLDSAPLTALGSISGTFAGLPQGATLTSNGKVFRIAYNVGPGNNDVTLTLIDVLSTGVTRRWDGGDALTNTWLASNNWVGDAAPLPGDTLRFSAGFSRRINFNDFPDGTTFDALLFDATSGQTLDYKTFGNALRLNDGVRQEPAPGSSIFTISGATTVSNHVTLNRSQTFSNALSGALRFAGGVALGTSTLSVGARAGSAIAFDASITGPGGFELPPLVTRGSVTLNSSNAITGPTVVGGLLIANHAQALGSPTAGPVRVGTTGLLRFDSTTNVTFTGSLIVATGAVETLSPATVSLATPILADGVNGSISNRSTGNLILLASLTNDTRFTLSGVRLAAGISIEHAGLLRVQSPGLEADGAVHNVTVLESGSSGKTNSVTGSGQIDTLFCTNPFVAIAPGGSSTDATLGFNDFNPLRVGRLQLDADATASFLLFPNRPGGGAPNTQLITSTAPDLGGARLDLRTLANLSPGQQFILVRNDSAAPVNGTFQNLPEGGFLSADNGNFGLQISYRGGDGNDVVLTVQNNTPPAIVADTFAGNEETALRFSLRAVDFERPPQTLTWTLLSAPPDAHLDSTGVLTWTPTEADGPFSYPIQVKVSDNGNPPLSGSGTVTFTINESNQPPRIFPVPDTNVIRGSTLTIQMTATDPDIPVNPLTWSLQSPPEGASIDRDSGRLTYTPASSSRNIETITIIVRDSSPNAINATSLSARLDLNVTVNPRLFVTNTNDAGPGSLRSALSNMTHSFIDQFNRVVTTFGGEIAFNIPGPAPFKISPATPLPALVQDTLIDGYTQPGAHPNTLPNGNDAQPLIELSGESLPNAIGLSCAGSRVTLRGLCLNKWGTAIATCPACAAGRGLTNAVVEGCFVGTDTNGLIALPNTVGISLGSAFGSRIGGPAPAQRNLISGNTQSGISLATNSSAALLHNLVIQGNFIGTDRTGARPLGNGAFGILFEDAVATTNSVIADNIVSANSQGGLRLAGVGNLVLRNKIGLGADALAPLGNNGSGIEIFGSRHRVGGNNGADANLIANNNGPGVHVSAGAGHSISANSIFLNTGLGIDLGTIGADLDDAGDGDIGPNNLQNKPVVSEVVAAGLNQALIACTLNSTPNKGFHIEFFHSPPSGQPQGRTFLGSGALVTDGSGDGSISSFVPMPSSSGFFTATATDSAGNTSEMSAGAVVTDFYNGILPTLSIINGNDQRGAPNLFLPQPLVVRVADRNGVPLTNAPVTFFVSQGDDSLASDFTLARFSTLPLRTAADGTAQVFCHLGSNIGVTDFIKAMATSAGSSVDVTFAVTAAQPTPEGMLLPGVPDSLALSAVFDLGPGIAPEHEIEDGIMLTRLDVTFAPDATVGQVNEALGRIRGGIVSMRPGLSGLSVAIPSPGSIEGLQAMAALLASAPGIRFAFPAQELAPLDLPPGDAGKHPEQFSHLLAERFPAAWNAAARATNNCGPRKVIVLVPDLFEHPLPASLSQFDTEVPGASANFTGGSTALKKGGSHGYTTASILAGIFNSQNPTGANPFSDCLDVRLVGMGGLTPLASIFQINRITASFPNEEIILSFSMAFQSYRSPGFFACFTDPCFPLITNLVPSPLQRAEGATMWKEQIRSSSTRPGFSLLAVTAAGNEKVEDCSAVYPGLQQATYLSFINITTLPDPFWGFITDPFLWHNSSRDPPFGSFAASPDQFNTLQLHIQQLGLDHLGPAENVLIVGSTSNEQTFDLLQPSCFSCSGSHVSAVGEGVPGLANKTFTGTSFATPQVAGLASYLWLLSPQLRFIDAKFTKQAILENAHTIPSGVKVIDAYSTVLSLDEAKLPTVNNSPVRFAILDVNGDGVFDHQDLLIHLQNGVTNAAPVKGSSPDYGRSDLNGDGFTGGSSNTERFDLDRDGSTQFGRAVFDLAIPQIIEGAPMPFNELSLTDKDILCYYAYSELYSKDPAAVAARTAILGDACAPVTVTVSPKALTVFVGESGIFTATVTGRPNLDQRVTWEVIQGPGQIGRDTGEFRAGCTPGQSVIRATSVAFPNKHDTATNQILPILSISPTNAALRPGDSLKLIATLANGASGTITWALLAGQGTFSTTTGESTIFTAGSTVGTCDIRATLAGSGCPASAFATVTISACALRVNVRCIEHQGISSTTSCTGASACGCNVPVFTLISGNEHLFVGNLLVSGCGSGNLTQVTICTDFKTFVLPFQADAPGIYSTTLGFRDAVTGDTAERTVVLQIFDDHTTSTISGCDPATGIFSLNPPTALVSTHEPVAYAFSWAVPYPKNWHDLRNLQFRIRDGDNSILWMLFNESDRTFQLHNPASNHFGPAGLAGDPNALETPFAWLDLSQTSVVAAGPTSPTVTLNLGLVFKPHAAGRTYTVEVSATDDEGNVDDFKPAGTLRITPFK